MFRHIGIYITRTASIDQPLSSSSVLLQGDRLRHADHSRLTDGIGSRRPSLLLFIFSLDCRFEIFHQGGDFINGLGIQKPRADGIGILVQLPRHAGDIDKAACGFDEWKKVLGRF